MKIKGIIVGALSFIASLFALRSRPAEKRSYLEGHPLEALGDDLAEMIVKLDNKQLTGGQKFRSALMTLKAIAVQRGVEAADWALTELIEKEVTASRGDPLEQVIDQGLGTAQEVLRAVDVQAIANGDAATRDAAVSALKDKLIGEGKSWLLSTHTLNLLLAAAVSKIMGAPQDTVN